MATGQDIIKFNIYKYNVNEVGFIIPGETNPILIDNQHVAKIEVIKRFDEDFFPIIRITANVPINSYYKILSKNDVKVRLNITTFIHDTSNKTPFETPYINSLFQLYTDENTPFLDKTFANRESGAVDNKRDDQLVPFDFYLFKVEHIRRYRHIINTVFANASLTDAVLYGFNQCKIDKVMMTPLSNRGAIKNVIMPPCNLLGFIENLQVRHGLYNTGYRLFQDIDILYLLDRSHKCTAYRDKEYKEVYFNIAESPMSDSLTFGIYDDKDNKRYMVNVPMNTLSISRVNTISKDAMYDGFYIVNTRANAVGKREAKLNAISGDTNFTIFEKQFPNPFIDSGHINALQSNNIIISVVLTEFNANIFTLNKEYVFVFADAMVNKTLSGAYSISNITMTLKREGTAYIASAVCEFKKA